MNLLIVLITLCCFVVLAAVLFQRRASRRQTLSSCVVAVTVNAMAVSAMCGLALLWLLLGLRKSSTTVAKAHR